MAFEDLSGLISGLEQQPHWQSRRQFRQIVDLWPKAVGHQVARQSRPVSLQRQVLYVSVPTSAWAQTLTFERRRILTNLNRYLALPLQDMRFSAAQWKAPRSPQLPPSDLLRQHPSYVAPPSPPPPAAPARQTPEDAFSTWAALIHTQQKHQPVCPQCRCHCPLGELDRWSVCALCIAQSWQNRPTQKQ